MRQLDSRLISVDGAIKARHTDVLMDRFLRASSASFWRKAKRMESGRARPVQPHLRQFRFRLATPVLQQSLCRLLFALHSLNRVVNFQVLLVRGVQLGFLLGLV